MEVKLLKKRLLYTFNKQTDIISSLNIKINLIMSISLQPAFTHLNHHITQVQESESDFKKLNSQRELIERLDHEIREEASKSVSFNWETHPTNRKLLDDVYDLDLMQGIEERVYAFTEQDQLITFMHKIASALEGKSTEVQNQHDLTSEKQKELMEFYQHLIEIISKLSQMVLSLLPRG